jgi:hypothetical protein
VHHHRAVPTTRNLALYCGVVAQLGVARLVSESDLLPARAPYGTRTRSKYVTIRNVLTMRVAGSGRSFATGKKPTKDTRSNLR